MAAMMSLLRPLDISPRQAKDCLCMMPPKGVHIQTAVNPKSHVKLIRKSIYKDGSSHCLGEPNCFWMFMHPQYYIRIVNPTKWDNRDSKLREAVVRWVSKLGYNVSGKLAHGRKGSCASPLSFS